MKKRAVRRTKIVRAMEESKGEFWGLLVNLVNSGEFLGLLPS